MCNELWISRAAFLEHYSAAQGAGFESPTEDCSSSARSQTPPPNIEPATLVKKSNAVLRQDESSPEP
jgi:hypothetical protein